MFSLKKILRKTVAPIYYLPYYLRQRLYSQRNRLCIMGDCQLEEFLAVRQSEVSRIIGFVPGYNRIRRKYKRKWFHQIDIWESHLKNLDSIGEETLIIVFQDYGAEKTAAGLRKMGLRDGIDFIFRQMGRRFEAVTPEPEDRQYGRR